MAADSRVLAHLAGGVRHHAGRGHWKRNDQLQREDTLVHYTDGVTEAFSANGSMFGEAGLLKSLSGAAGPSADATISTVIEAVRGHAAGFPQSDDLTVVAVRRSG